MFKYILPIPLIAAILIGCININRGNMYEGVGLIVLGSFILGAWTFRIANGWDK